MSTLDIGDSLNPTVTFRLPPTAVEQAANQPGGVAAPTAVIVRVRRPDGTEDTYSGAQVVSPSLGVYQLAAAIVVDQAGPWYIRYEGTGALVAAVETRYNVRDSVFYP